MAMMRYSTLPRSIWPIDRMLTSIASLGENGPEGNGNDEVLYPLQIYLTHTEDSNRYYHGGRMNLRVTAMMRYSTHPRSLWLKNRTLTCSTTLGEYASENNVYDEILYPLQIYLFHRWPLTCITALEENEPECHCNDERLFYPQIYLTHTEESNRNYNYEWEWT